MAVRGPFVFITPRRQPAVASSRFTCNASTFGLERGGGKNVKRRGFFFGTRAKQKGLGFLACTEEKPGARMSATFSSAGSGSEVVGRVVCQSLGKSGNCKRVDRSQKVLVVRVSTSFLASLWGPLLLFICILVSTFQSKGTNTVK